MKKVSKVALSGDKEAELQASICKSKTSPRKVTRLPILFLAHAGEKEAATARAFETGVNSVKLRFPPI